MKRILILNPINLYPTVMMSQRRALNQIFSLSKQHIVDVATIIKNDKTALLSEEFFKDRINKFIGIEAINYDSQLFSRYYYNFIFMIKYYLFGIKRNVSNLSSNYIKKKIINIINSDQYDIIISHYWWNSFFFLEKMDYKPITIIDLHAMVDEDVKLNENGVYYRMNHSVEKKSNIKNLNFQKEIFNGVDLVIPNSVSQIDILNEKYSQISYYYCPNGQDMSEFSLFRGKSYDDKTVLFYGSFGSLQNNRAFKLFYNNVWPIILKGDREAKLLIVGNNPPESITSLAKHPNITVTGFVDDIREYICQACCMVLPMDIGIGFRGRVVEVMALGVPVIGNHNALDCIGLDNKINGFITDDYMEMANYTLQLMDDQVYRTKISKNSIKFAEENYSMQNTFDKLSKYLADFSN